jgi:hypothetical protein
LGLQVPPCQFALCLTVGDAAISRYANLPTDVKGSAEAAHLDGLGILASQCARVVCIDVTVLDGNLLPAPEAPTEDRVAVRVQRLVARDIESLPPEHLPDGQDPLPRETSQECTRRSCRARTTDDQGELRC